MTETRVVLIVEDMPRFSELIKDVLLESGLVAEVLVAADLNSGQEQFRANKERLSAILMDACLKGESPDTLELTRDMRANYQGPIVAMSRDDSFRRQQMAAGCDHQSPKYEVAFYLLKLFSGSQ